LAVAVAGAIQRLVLLEEEAVREVTSIHLQLPSVETFLSLLELADRAQHPAQQMEHLVVTVLLEL
jgi:hypothetical protein